ncbi:MAG: DUF3298 domain-containing protein, partial [Bacteroidales bacterium]|nr:DUF3298 domain-containing protein [Bacteroidales bacterium]
TIRLAFLFIINGYGQKIDFTGYKHLSGKVDKEDIITFDLVIIGDQIIGYYNNFNYGKTISLELSGEIYQNNIVVNIAESEQTIFSGEIIDSKHILGTWNSIDKGIPYSTMLEEIYNEGSIRMDNQYISDQHKLLPINNSPIALFQCNMINPTLELATSSSIRNILLSQFFDTKSEAYNPEAIIAELKANFFAYYQQINIDNYTDANYTKYNWMKQKLMSVRYNEDYILTVKLHNYAYTGGSFGTGISQYVVMDSRNGKRVKLNDIFKGEFGPKLKGLINDKFRSKYKIPKERKLSEAGMFVDEIPLKDNFYINKTGIGFHFNVYEIATPDYGIIDIFIPFDELQQTLKEDGIISWR